MKHHCSDSSPEASPDVSGVEKANPKVSSRNKKKPESHERNRDSNRVPDTMGVSAGNAQMTHE